MLVLGACTCAPSDIGGKASTPGAPSAEPTDRGSEEAPAQASRVQPGSLRQLALGYAWGGALDDRGVLWLWGEHPLLAEGAPVEPWTARPAPLGGQVESSYTDSRTLCVTFEDADARCWAKERSSSFGPFPGSAGGREIIVHDLGAGGHYAFVRMADGRLLVFEEYSHAAPIKTLSDVIDIADVGFVAALTRDGTVLRLLRDLHEYPHAELSEDRVGVFPGARQLVDGPGDAPLCLLDGAGALHCPERLRPDVRNPEAATALEHHGATIRAVALDSRHACALLDDGTVACAGEDGHGERGRGTRTTSRSGRGSVSTIPRLADARAIAVRTHQTCVLLEDRVRCWGVNAAVQERETPRRHGLDARDIMGDGFTRTCAVDRADRTWCWGLMSDEVDAIAPTRVRLPSGPPVALSGGCFIDASMIMSCGALVPDPKSPDELVLDVRSRPIEVLHAGASGILHRRLRGRPRLDEPELGSPVVSGPIVDSTMSSLGGADQLCVLTTSGEIRCWETDYGPSGAACCGEFVVSGVVDPIDIAGSCALQRDGTVLCWGHGGDDLREVGSGSAIQLVATDDDACVLRPDGKASCFDPDDPRTTEQRAPWPAPELSDAIELVAGQGHVCALERGGDVVCWGHNGYGQLGALPVEVNLEPRDVSLVGTPHRPTSSARER